MKKVISILMISLLFFCLCPAQENKPFEGYDGFSWGTAIRKITKKYPYGREGTSANLQEYYVGDSTSFSPIDCSKTFRFYEKKLYFGKTEYSYIFGEGFEKQFAKIYDNVLADLKRDYNLGVPRTASSKTPQGYLVSGSKWYVSPNFCIELVKVEDFYGIHHIAVTFYEPLVRSKAEQKSIP